MMPDPLILCVDKTGTLTENQMRVERVSLPDIVGHGLSALEHLSVWSRSLIVDISTINSTAHLQKTDHGTTCIGSPTEGALLYLAERLGTEPETHRQQAQVVTSFSFSSERKRMTTVVQRPTGVRLLVKGAPDVVLPLCRQILGKEGPRSISDDDLGNAHRTSEEWAGSALRVLALAYRDLPEPKGDLTSDNAEQSLVLVGLVGIGDPVRADVPEALRVCNRAGVEVKVVTGDHLATGRAVAERLGILAADDLVMEGAEFRGLSDDELLGRLAKLRVVGRAVPSDKARLVALLKRQNRVVAVTGDGTNDGPALRTADVGLSMGLSGTDVAREASDIVILDDSFASIVKALRWGRAIFRNVQRFIQFQLTVSIVALVTAFLAGLTGMGTPLNVVQLLWVNLIMDTLAALALATEPPHDALLDRPPHGRTEPLISRTMWTQILGVGALMLVTLTLALYSNLFGTKLTASHDSFIFNAFVWLQIGNLLNCRATTFDEPVFRGLWKSRLFLALFVLIAVVQVGVVEVGGAFFHTTPLSWREWLTCLALALGIVNAGAILRGGARSLPERYAKRIYDWSLSAEENWTRFRDFFSAPIKGIPVIVLGAVGSGVALLSMVLRALGPLAAVLSFGLFAMGLAALAVWAWESRDRLSSRIALSHKRHVVVSLCLASILVVMANVIGARHYRRIDLTSAKKFSLSPQTTAILERLEKPVTLTTVFRQGPALNEVGTDHRR